MTLGINAIHPKSTASKSIAMGDLYQHAMQWFNRLDRQEWLLVLIAVVIGGFLCLRGMGSRKQY